MKELSTWVDGLRVRYRDSGASGPTVLMLHGIGGSLELWASQYVVANAGLRLVSLDLPSHGLSDFSARPWSPLDYARFVWRFVDELGLSAVHLTGNSMGGAIALRMLGEQPGRVKSVLLAAAATLGREAPLPFRLMTLPKLGEWMTRAGPMAVQQQVQAIFHSSYSVSDALRSIIERNVMRPGAQAAFLSTLRQMSDLGGQRTALLEDARALLQSARVPMLLLHGVQDRVLPCAHSEKAAAQAAGVRFQGVDDCGHTPQLEQPDVFNQALRSLVLQG